MYFGRPVGHRKAGAPNTNPARHDELGGELLRGSAGRGRVDRPSMAPSKRRALPRAPQVPPETATASLLQHHRAAQFSKVPGRTERVAHPAGPRAHHRPCGFCSAPEVSLVPRCDFCGCGQMEGPPRMVPLSRALLQHSPDLSSEQLVRQLLLHATRERFELVRLQDPVAQERVFAKTSVQLLLNMVEGYRYTVLRLMLRAWHETAHARHKQRGRQRTPDTIHAVWDRWEALASGALALSSSSSGSGSSGPGDGEAHAAGEQHPFTERQVAQAKDLFYYHPQTLLELLGERKGLLIKLLLDGTALIADTLQANPTLPFLFLPLLTPGSCLDVDVIPRSQVPSKHVLLRVHNMVNLGEDGGDQIFDRTVNQFTAMADLREQLAEDVGTSNFVLFLRNQRVHHDSDTETLEYMLPPRTHAVNALAIDHELLHEFLALPDDMRNWIHPNLCCLFSIHLSDEPEAESSSDDEDLQQEAAHSNAARLKFQRELNRLLVRKRVIGVRRDIVDSEEARHGEEIRSELRETCRQTALEVARMGVNDLSRDTTDEDAVRIIRRTSGCEAGVAKVIYSVAHLTLSRSEAVAMTAAALAANEMAGDPMSVLMAAKDAAVEAGADDDAADLAADAVHQAIEEFETAAQKLPTTSAPDSLKNRGATPDSLVQLATVELEQLQRREMQLHQWIVNVDKAERSFVAGTPGQKMRTLRPLPLEPATPTMLEAVLTPIVAHDGGPKEKEATPVRRRSLVRRSTVQTNETFFGRESLAVVAPGVRRDSNHSIPKVDEQDTANETVLKLELRIQELERELALAQRAPPPTTVVEGEEEEEKEADKHHKHEHEHEHGRSKAAHEFGEIEQEVMDATSTADDRMSQLMRTGSSSGSGSGSQRSLLRRGKSGKLRTHRRRLYKLPPVYDELWSSPKPLLTGKTLLSLSMVHKTIRVVYMCKLAAEQAGTAQTLSEVAYDHFMQMHGLRKLGEGHLLRFVDSLVRFKDESLGARHCGWFMGLWGDKAKASDLWPMFSHCIEFCNQSPVGVPTRVTDEGMALSYVRAKTCASHIFGTVIGPNSDEYREVLRRMEELVYVDSESQSRVDEDRFLDLMVNVYEARTEQAAHLLRALFEAGDVNGDGVLTWDEFKALVLHADPSVPEQEVSQMYREAHGDEEHVQKESFVTTSLQHGLFTYRKRHLKALVTSASTEATEASTAPVREAEPVRELDVTADLDESREATMELLVDAWHRSEEAIDASIKAQQDPYKRGFLEERRSQLMRQMGTGASVEVAWLTYRMLIAETKRDASAKMRHSILTVAEEEADSDADPSPRSPGLTVVTETGTAEPSSPSPPSSPHTPGSPGSKWRVVKKLKSSMVALAMVGRYHADRRVACVSEASDEDLVRRGRTASGDSAHFAEALDRAATPRKIESHHLEEHFDGSSFDLEGEEEDDDDQEEGNPPVGEQGSELAADALDRAWAATLQDEVTRAVNPSVIAPWEAGQTPRNNP